MTFDHVKLLYVATMRLPTEKAHGLQIMKTCEAFGKTGATVTLMVPTRRNALHEDPFIYYGVTPNFKVSMQKAPDFFTWGPFGFFLSTFLFSEAVHQTLEFRNADVIYSRDAFVLAQYIFLGKNLVYEAHTTPTSISKFVARRVSKVVVISQGLKLAYIKAGVPQEKIIVAPDAIDLAAFAPERAGAETKEAARVRLGLPLDRKIAMYIGRLDGWKGVETFCEAATHFPNNCMAVVIGGEPAQVAEFKKNYITAQIKFLGYRPYQELANNQIAADVLVLPNTAKDINSAKYTSPLKLFTYMASGVPIVASDLSSIREILTEDSAYFFVPDDAKLLAKKIAEATDHHELAATKALTARENVKNHTWESRAQTILTGLGILQTAQ